MIQPELVSQLSEIQNAPPIPKAKEPERGNGVSKQVVERGPYETKYPCEFDQALLQKYYHASEGARRAVDFLLHVADLILSKNALYGDSAINPVRIFSKASPVEQLLVRIDDKLSRIKNIQLDSPDGEATLDDLTGYLALLAAARVMGKGLASRTTGLLRNAP